MLRGAAVVFLVASFPTHGQAGGIQSSFAQVYPRQGYIAVAEVGSPPQKVGATLRAWDHIKSSNDVSELEEFVACYKGSFLAELARRRIEVLESQRRGRPPGPTARTKLT